MGEHTYDVVLGGPQMAPESFSFTVPHIADAFDIIKMYMYFANKPVIALDIREDGLALAGTPETLNALIDESWKRRGGRCNGFVYGRGA